MGLFKIVFQLSFPDFQARLVERGHMLLTQELWVTVVRST